MWIRYLLFFALGFIILRLVRRLLVFKSDQKYNREVRKGEAPRTTIDVEAEDVDFEEIKSKK